MVNVWDKKATFVINNTPSIMNKYITSASDLVTSHDQTRAGFIEAALEKNKKAAPFVEAAKTLKVMASAVSDPNDLLKIKEIRPALLTASGLSDKALTHFTEDDKTLAIKELISNFLKPAGEHFVDELVYRYLLVKGDALGGSMRNFVGSVAKRKVTRKIISVLNTMGIPFEVLTRAQKPQNLWAKMSYVDAYNIADDIAALTWTYNQKKRVLFFDTTIPTVGKNVDICLYNGGAKEYDCGDIVKQDGLAVMFGELKGGIDPAGADEHWKTGNTALERIRTAFGAKGLTVKTSFVGAAIASSMATEIWKQLSDGTMTNAANLTSDNQFTDYCEWIVKL